jgi:hypothetical protein
MRVRRVATFAAVAAAALAAGCGEDDFENEPRPPVPMELSGVIQEDKVTVSPSRNIGAGPFVITISNQTDARHTVTLEGQSIVEEVGPVAPLDTATIQRTLTPGTYEVRAGTMRAVRREITPASLDIGAERPNSNSELLLP